MMLCSKTLDIGTAYTRSPCVSRMSIMQSRRDETAARTAWSSSTRERAKAHGQSGVFEHRPLTQADDRQAARPQRKVQAENDGVVLLCRD
jgi:hypothetical protein